MISEDKLMAYVDGELSRDACEAIEAEAERNPELRNAIIQERLLRSELADLHSPAMKEQVPERLARILQPVGDTVVAFRQRTPERRARYLAMITAMAASLVLGVFLGPAFGFGSDPRDGASNLQIDGQLAAALHTQLASEQQPQDAIQIGITFVGRESEVCRTFEAADMAGLACLIDNEWQMRLLAPKNSSPDTEYQRANSAFGLVMSSTQEMIGSEPMNADQERQARNADWRALAD